MKSQSPNAGRVVELSFTAAERARLESAAKCTRRPAPDFIRYAVAHAIESANEQTPNNADRITGLSAREQWEESECLWKVMKNGSDETLYQRRDGTFLVAMNAEAKPECRPLGQAEAAAWLGQPQSNGGSKPLTWLGCELPLKVIKAMEKCAAANGISVDELAMLAIREKVTRELAKRAAEKLRPAAPADEAASVNEFSEPGLTRMETTIYETLGVLDLILQRYLSLRPEAGWKGKKPEATDAGIVAIVGNVTDRLREDFDAAWDERRQLRLQGEDRRAA